MTLLVQSCSASKNEVDGAVPAHRLYDGYFHRIIGKARREGDLRDDLAIHILSAEHGLIPEDREIETYDRRMDEARAEELAASVVSDLREAVRDGGHDRIVVNAGADYRGAIAPAVQQADVDVYRIEGGGIGVKGGKLKQFLRGNDEVLDPWKPSNGEVDYDDENSD